MARRPREDRVLEGRSRAGTSIGQLRPGAHLEGGLQETGSEGVPRCPMMLRGLTQGREVSAGRQALLPQVWIGDCYAGKRGEAEASSGATAGRPARKKVIWSVVS